MEEQPTVRKDPLEEENMAETLPQVQELTFVDMGGLVTGGRGLKRVAGKVRCSETL